jgi:hypothetical protein
MQSFFLVTTINPRGGPALITRLQPYIGSASRKLIFRTQENPAHLGIEPPEGLQPRRGGLAELAQYNTEWNLSI